MSYTQIASLLGAVLAVAIGGVGIFLNWFNAADGLGLIFAGLAILGVHTGGTVASNTTN
jgi:hypothetical protein